MPPVIAAALVQAGMTLFWANVIAYTVMAIAGTVISYGVSKLATIIGGKPKSQNFQFNAENRKQMVRSSIESRKIIYGKCRVSGPLVYVASNDNNGIKNRILHMVVPLAGHEIEAIDEVYFNDTLLTLDGDGYATNTKYLENGQPGYVRVMKHLGSPTQVANSVMTSEAPSWTSAHRLQGIAYLYIRLVFRQDMFQSLPNVSAVIRGKKVYDPRTLTTGYSNNAALCVLDYLRDPIYGIKSGDEFIDFDSFTAAANICDENVTLKAGGTTKRYKIDGQIDSASNLIDNLEKMTSGIAGACSFIGGKWRIHTGAYSLPVATIDENWLANEMQVQTKTPRSELFNAVKGIYVDPDKGWQPTTFPMVSNSLYEDEDGGQQIIRDIDLPFTINVEDAQRIAKIILEKSRQGIVVTMPCNFKAIQLAPWDNVYVNNSILGWSNKIFKVINWQLQTADGVVLTLQEESSASYDWNNGEATLFDPAPNTNLPAATIDPPGSPQVTESLYSTGNAAGIKAKAIVTWGASPSAFVNRYELQYKLAGEVNWVPNGQTIETRSEIIDLAAGTYNFRIKAITATGRESVWVESTRAILGLTAPPADVTNFTLNTVNNNAHLTWDAATDLDVLSGGFFHIRWSGDLNAASWSESITLLDNVSGGSTSVIVPLLNGTYLIKAVDSTGNSSESPAMIRSTLRSVLDTNVVATSNQHPDFTGVKINMFVSGGVLRLDGGTLFDSGTGLFDDATGLFDNYGAGLATTGEYKFNNFIDLGAVYTSRVTANIKSLIYNSANLFDSKAGLFDAATGLFDGDDVTGVNVYWWVRTTNDNPSGSPVWSDWQRFYAGDFTARAYEFKLTVDSDDPAKNIDISELSVTVDVPERDERFINQAIAAGGTTITYATPFFAQPFTAASINNSLSGDSVKYTHVTSGGKWTGVTVQVLNGGAGVARNGDVLIRGY